jgi:hypothetical protein
MKRAVLILAAIAFLIIPLMIYTGVPLQEGFAENTDESTWYNFFIGTDATRITIYIVLLILMFGFFGYMSTPRKSSAKVVAPPQAGGTR